MAISDEQLYRLLAENQYVGEGQLEIAKEEATQKKISLYDALLEKDIVSDENLGKVVAEYLGIPFITLSKHVITDNLLRIIPHSVAKKQKIIVFSYSDDGIKVATPIPDNPEMWQLLAKKTGKNVFVYYATERDITEALRLYKKGLQSTFDELLKKQAIDTSGKEFKDAPVAKIVDTLIDYAYDSKASDIHIEPRKYESKIRFRIDGVLHDVISVPRNLHAQIVTKVKVLAKLQTDEHFSAQDGKIKIKLTDEELDIRVSIVPIVEGEKVVLRLLSARSRQFSLSDLGMSDDDLKKVSENYLKPYGMILVTGPTGSGKTTTIYAVLKILNTKEKNIATVEDPVEYEIDGINQIQVNPKTNLTFADGLRSILRQDPDIIFVGEIRDEDTAGIAINSAMTGHLVLSTLHTNDAATAIPRLLDMKIEPFLVSSTVNLIIGQRLVRKICDSCRVSFTTTQTELIKHFSKEDVKKYFGSGVNIRMYRGKGCPVCHQTGYSGRIGVFETLEVSGEIQKLINQKADAGMIKDKAIREGMVTMLDDGLSKVQQGITTIEEVLRATTE